MSGRANAMPSVFSSHFPETCTSIVSPARPPRGAIEATLGARSGSSPAAACSKDVSRRRAPPALIRQTTFLCLQVGLAFIAASYHVGSFDRMMYVCRCRVHNLEFLEFRGRFLLSRPTRSTAKVL